MFGSSCRSQSPCLQRGMMGSDGGWKPFVLKPLPTHRTCWSLAPVYFLLESSCPWKINRYLFRKSAVASRNLTLGERERTCCYTPSLPKCDAATVAPFLEERKEMFHVPVIYDVLPISITSQPNKIYTGSPLSHA